MAYQALYRKYRPASFEEIVGQDHITITLANQVKTKQISHAYLFTGSRGTGKTSAAKIFAKAINCQNPNNGSPCFNCGVCKALSETSNIDVVEIDAASNNRVDEIRDIREKVKFLPINGKFKVYIIDEVHMLTDSAFNALLKTLEEPPEHVVFILATTEVHKLPATILSRCMRFDFKLVSNNVLEQHLKNVFKKENIKCQQEALKLIAAAAEGSVRDLLSVADCIAAYCKNNITTDDVIKALGCTDVDYYINLTSAINAKNVGDCLEIIQKVYDEGKNLTLFAKNLTKHYRDILVLKCCQNGKNILAYTKDITDKINLQAQTFTQDELMENMKIFSAIESELKYALSPKTLLETAIITAITENNSKKN